MFCSLLPLESHFLPCSALFPIQLQYFIAFTFLECSMNIYSFAYGILSAWYTLTNWEKEYHVFLDLAQAFTTLRSLSWLSKGGLTFMSHYVLCIHVSHHLYHSIVLVGIHFQLFRSLSIDAVPHSLHISLYLHTRTSPEYQHATFLLLAGVFIFLLQQNISRLYHIDMTEQSTKTYKHFYSC